MPDNLEHLLPLAHAAAAPIGLQGVVSEDVKLGQVWRARWGTVSVPIIVMGGLSDENREWCVPVVPISIEPRGENDNSLILVSDANLFGVDATVWCNLQTDIPLRTLDVCFGDVSSQVTAYCNAVLRGEEIELPMGTRAGLPISSIFAGDAEIEAVLEDDLAELKNAPGLAVDNSPLVRKHMETQLKKVGLTKVMDALGLAQPAAMQVIRVQTNLTPGQAVALADLVNMSVDNVSQIFQTLPVEVICTVEHPRWRQQLDLLAVTSKRDIYDVREEAAHGIFAMAARQTELGNTYGDRLARWIEEQLQSRPPDWT